MSLMLISLLFPALAFADESKGRITGGFEMRGTMYSEQRTTVVAPGLAGHLNFANGTTLRASSLVDVITSSSVAVDIVASASVGVDPLARRSFRERRVEGTLAYGGPLRGTGGRATLEGAVRYSHEPDYRSYAATLAASYALPGRSTTFNLASTYARDEVWQMQRMTDTATGETTKRYVRVNQGDGFSSVVAALSVSQILNTVAILDVGYEFSYLTGYLGNPYRRVVVDGLVERERVPDSRHRHTLSTLLRLARPRVHGSLHLLVRGYLDDWSVAAITTESRWYQTMGRYLLARGRFRYYRQRGAYFDSEQGVNAPSYPFGTEYTTANPRYASMQSFELGAAIITRLSFLTRGDHGLADGELEFAFDRRFSDNRFGDAMTGSVALRMPLR